MINEFPYHNNLFKYKNIISIIEMSSLTDINNKWLNLLNEYPNKNDQEKDEIVDTFLHQLRNDLHNLNEGGNVSNCSIFIPRKKSSFNKKYGIVTQMSLKMFPII